MIPINSHTGAITPIRQIRQMLYKRWTQLIQAKKFDQSAEYLAWRRRFFHRRLGRGLWIGLMYALVLLGYWLYIFLFGIEQIRSDLDRLFGKPWLADYFREIIVIAFPVVSGLIVACLLTHKTQWGRRHPALLFLIFASTLNGFVTQIISTPYGVPITPAPTVFLAFAVLMPLCWRLHLFSQLLPITYYTVVLPILGITGFRGEPIWDIYNLGNILEIGLVCIICNLGVFVYEQLTLAEFESRRELQLFLHAISHDLRNPVMGASVVLKSLLNKVVDGHAQVSEPALSRLLQGSDRQLNLINILVEAYHAESQGIILHCQPLQLSTVVEAVLADIETQIRQNKIELRNLIHGALPLVSADPTHLWRVLSNLIDNALKHNPPGIQLTLEAEVINDKRSFTEWLDKLSFKFQVLPKTLYRETAHLKAFPKLLCRIQDNGIGIPTDQCKRLFELYTRGKRARYMPGLGLGLYLCKEIITVHGGEIGVISQIDCGSTFWFTLPLAPLTEPPCAEKL